MMQAAPALYSPPTQMQAGASSVLLRTVVIGLTAFLTVVDLFATQAARRMPAAPSPPISQAMSRAISSAA